MSVDPTREQFDQFKKLPRDEEIWMLNLIRFREKAVYPAGHALAGKDLSGRDAYREYMKTTANVFTRVGGKKILQAPVELVLTGPASERWDLFFVASYPDAAKFLEMVTDKEYRTHVAHRGAGVADSRLIRLHPRKKTAKL